ncbi:MAG: hypothetical protein ACLSDO_00550 [Anaerotruncus colihominis]
MAMGMIGAWKATSNVRLRSGKAVVAPPGPLKNGISLLPEDRKRRCDRQAVRRNISASSLPRFSKFGVINSLLEKQNNRG